MSQVDHENTYRTDVCRYFILPFMISAHMALIKGAGAQRSPDDTAVVCGHMTLLCLLPLAGGRVSGWRPDMWN